MDQHNHQPVESSVSFTEFFSQIDFMPHGHCYLWKAPLVWTHVVSDFLIGLAYVGISYLLYVLVRKIKVPFSGMFLAFGAFILFCGMTHFVEIWNLWNADYWFGGLIKFLTAAASVATAVLLIPIAPKVEAMAFAAKLSEERKSQLEDANKELATLYEKVKESDSLKTQFFANVSHELRTPLALILGPAEQLLSRGKLNEPDTRSVQVVLRNARTLLKRVNDLLDISKLEAGRLNPSYARVDLVKVIRITAAHFETIMQSKGIFFSLQTPDSLEVEIDPDKIQRVFMNLLSNAIKFVPNSGRIRVSVESPNGMVLITVSDTGTGIKPELVDVIFERFRQGDEGIDRRFGGTGLGLAIVKDFVEMHGGKVRVVQGQAPGATFVVELPKKAPPGTFVEASNPEFMGASEASIQGFISELMPQTTNPEVSHLAAEKKPSVLVCEDNPDMNQFVADTLSIEFNVIRAVNGSEGLAKALALKPDLIVSDIMMPHMSGDQLVKAIKANSELNQIPILLLSARADDSLRVELLREGASDYVMKPFQPEELRARVKNLLIMKRTRDVLQSEIKTHSNDLVRLAKDLALEKHQAQHAKENAEILRAHAEKANQVRSTFLSLVSHELNTPLTSQYLTLQTFFARGIENLNEAQKKMLDRLLAASKQLKTLVESLLEYTRAESGKIPIHVESLSLEEIAREVVDESLALAQKKGINLKLKLNTQLPSLQSDRKLVRIVMSNLVMNALKFTQKGSVEIVLQQNDNSQLIQVTDTGVGIKKEDQNRIFDPFHQLEPIENKSNSGVGLGLALVRQIVTSLQGSISVKSAEGEGSTFSVDIPNYRLPTDSAEA